MTTHKLISEIVEQDICIGCGLCAAVCPKKNIRMEWSDKGEIIPVIDECCGEDICARLCIATCPILVPGAINASPNRSDIVESLIGDYEACYAGYDNDPALRQRGTSGGMLTWLLTELLEKGDIDGVITAVKSDDAEDSIFQFGILRTAEDVRRAAGSKYYPVEAGSVLKQILSDKSDDVYALVGLPCLLQGVQIARTKYKRLDRKIKYTFSLTCGQLPNAAYTEVLAQCSGVKKSSLVTVDYRNKAGTTSASNYVFLPTNKAGESGRPLYWVGEPSYLWENSFFIHGACKFCDDLFGRSSDAAFMDAWLPEYTTDTQGHSLILVRNTSINDAFSRGAAAGSCQIKPVPVADIINSQSTQITKKTEMLSANLYFAKQNGLRITDRAIPPSKTMFKRWKKDISLQWHTMKESKRIWAELKSQGEEQFFFTETAALHRKISVRRNLLYIQQGVRKLVNNPLGTVRNVFLHQLRRNRSNA